MLFRIILCLITLLILLSILYKVSKKKYFQIILRIVFCGLIGFLIFYQFNSISNKNTIPINNGYVFKGDRASVIELKHKKWLVSDTETSILINKANLGYIYNFLTHFSTPDDVIVKSIESTNNHILISGNNKHSGSIMYWLILCHDNSIYGPLSKDELYVLCENNEIQTFHYNID